MEQGFDWGSVEIYLNTVKGHIQ